MPSPPLSTREKLAYAVGDCGANFVFQTQIAFLPFFYTDVLGITAAAAGNILLVSRILDAFNDPIVGALADRTHSRWGHYRPWIIATALPLAIGLVLCYTAPAFSNTGRVVWAIVTYNLLMVLYAANNIPYSALAGVMTDDSGDRTILLSWRFLSGMATALAVNMFTLDLVKYFGQGNDAVGYSSTMAVWAVVVVLSFVITVAFTRERINPSPRQQAPLRQDLSDLVHNGPWIALFTLAISIYLQLALRGGATLYYFTHYLQREDLFGLFNGVGLAITMVGVALARPLAARFGKRHTFQACLLLSALWMALIALVPRDGVRSLFALQILLQFSFGPTIPLLWTMMADVADYSEWRTHRRSTALAFASIAFGLKLGFGLGAWLSGQWLDATGYSLSEKPSSIADRAIVPLVSFFPAVALFIGFVILYYYHIDDPVEREIRDDLRGRRSELRS